MEKGKQLTVKELMTSAGLSRMSFYQLFDSREDFFIGALRYRLDENYARLLAEKRCGAPERKLFYLYKRILLEQQTPAFTGLIEHIWKKKDDVPMPKYWRLIEDHVKRLLVLFGKAPTLRNQKIMLFTLAFVHSSVIFDLRDVLSRLVQGFGVEFDILIRELRRMPKAKRNTETQDKRQEDEGCVFD